MKTHILTHCKQGIYQNIEFGQKVSRYMKKHTVKHYCKQVTCQTLLQTGNLLNIITKNSIKNNYYYSY